MIYIFSGKYSEESIACYYSDPISEKNTMLLFAL